MPRGAAARAYLGHETCEGALPPLSVARELGARLHGQGLAMTLATPFLTTTGIDAALRLVDALRAIDDRLEVACGDLGLLARLARHGGVTLIAGRLLATQPADPRLLRVAAPPEAAPARRRIRHVDGTRAELTRALPSRQYLDHVRTTWLDRPDAIDWLLSLGVARAELSNVGQGLATAGRAGWSYALHLPWVIVSVLRACPGPEERMSIAAPCPHPSCHGSQATWHHDGFPVELQRHDNALTYAWTDLPDDLGALSIDRLVRHAPPGP